MSQEIDLVRSHLPPLPDDARRYFDFLIENTLANPSFSATADEIFETLKLHYEDEATRAKTVGKTIRMLRRKVVKALSKAETPDAAGRVYCISYPVNTKSTGIRILIERRPAIRRIENRNRSPLEIRDATGLWRSLLGKTSIQQTLIFYDAPALIKAQFLKSAKTVTIKNNRGIWARSGDLASVFDVGRILHQLKKTIRILTWQDSQHDDVMTKKQCIVMIGYSSHFWSKERLRTREEWQKRRAFVFEEIVGESSCTQIWDTREKVHADRPSPLQHVEGTGGGSDTDYAVIFFFDDTKHEQLIIGVVGTSGASNRAASLLVTQDDYAADLQETLSDHRKKTLAARPRAFEILYEMKLRDGILKGFTPIESVVYES